MVKRLEEYSCPLRHPAKISDIQELQSVQNTFTSGNAGMKHLNN
jgi:hypothetical protein